jgi:hypothetical protein
MIHDEVSFYHDLLQPGVLEVVKFRKSNDTVEKSAVVFFFFGKREKKLTFV